jgi:hypothetical protein
MVQYSFFVIWGCTKAQTSWLGNCSSPCRSPCLLMTHELDESTFLFYTMVVVLNSCVLCSSQGVHVVILLMLSQFTKFSTNPQLTCCSTASQTRAKTRLAFLCSSYHSLVLDSSPPITACPSNLAPSIRRWANVDVWLFKLPMYTK